MADGARHRGPHGDQALALGHSLGTQRMFFDVCDAVNAYDKRGITV
jgi:hypothetical protein